MKTSCLFIACLLLFSCSSDTRPADLIPPEKMELLIWDQLKADAFTKEFLGKDSTKDVAKENRELQEKIFRKYKTDKTTFYKSYRYYIEHGNMMKALMDSVMAKQSRAREKSRIPEIFKLKRNEQSKK